MKNAVEQVVQALGGVTRVAIVAQVNPKSVYMWMKRGLVTHPRAAKRLALAQRTVSFEELLGVDKEGEGPRGLSGACVTPERLTLEINHSEAAA